MDLNKLRLLPGSNMHLELASNPGQKYQTRLIGYYPGRSVLVTTPMLANDRPLLVRKEQEVVIRFFSNKSACAFRSEVRHLCTTPFHYLHLSYPGQVEVGEIRKSERVLANVQVSVINKSRSEYDTVSGAIVDISTTGAKLETLQPIGDIGDVLMLTAKVKVGRVTRLVTWDCEIKSDLDRFDMVNTVAAYGIEFHYLNDLDYLALHALVYSQLARGIESTL